MPDYLEFAPPPHLACMVECFWSMRRDGEPATLHRVVPDGCADILFAAGTGSATLQVIGAMSTYEDFQLPAGESMVAVRFRPGMWASQIGVPGHEITDQRISLEHIRGADARGLLERMAEARSTRDRAAVLACSLTAPPAQTPVQRAIAWMEARHGCVSLDEVARHAGVSVRHFRRLCLENTGLSPKLLARVLRFRYALSHARSQTGDHAGLAAECGYTDQSHFIAEFRRFSGKTPSVYFGAAEV